MRALASLSPRTQSILELVTQEPGILRAEICRRLELTQHSARACLDTLMDRIAVHERNVVVGSRQQIAYYPGPETESESA